MPHLPASAAVEGPEPLYLLGGRVPAWLCRDVTDDGGGESLVMNLILYNLIRFMSIAQIELVDIEYLFFNVQCLLLTFLIVILHPIPSITPHSKRLKLEFETPWLVRLR